jgi:hypothetical protein
VLAVTIHNLEPAVVAPVRLNLERIGLALEEGHFFETWPRGTVVPQYHYEGQPVPAGSFEVKPADAKTAVADDEHDLLSRGAS